jgi:hypothetical protein
MFKKFEIISVLALQQYAKPVDISKSISMPDFITINKTAAQLGLTKVRDIHQYR